MRPPYQPGRHLLSGETLPRGRCRSHGSGYGQGKHEVPTTNEGSSDELRLHPDDRAERAHRPGAVEVIEIIREPHAGVFVTYRGEHFDVDSARVSDRPDTPVVIVEVGAASRADPSPCSSAYGQPRPDVDKNVCPSRDGPRRSGVLTM